MSVYDFSYTSISGEDVSMAQYAGKVLLLVNTASKCGLAPQFDGLEQLYQTYGERGLVVIGFPSNQFRQELDDEQAIGEFCKVRYGVTFPLSERIEVNGANALPLFTYLKEQMPGDIEWNFTKFLVDRTGAVVGRYEPSIEPQALVGEIERLLESGR
jgi:glutathione peroxidase